MEIALMGIIALVAHFHHLHCWLLVVAFAQLGFSVPLEVYSLNLVHMEVIPTTMAPVHVLNVQLDITVLMALLF